MTNLFLNIRHVTLFLLFASAAVVLGISASLAARLLPFDREFIIFALVTSGATVVFTWVLWLRSTPGTEAGLMFVFTVLWLSLAAYSVDRIGYVQCFQLSGNVETFHDKTMSAATHCRRMKAIMGFSWALFGILLLSLIILLVLTIRARTRGATSDIWLRSISEIPWFGQYVSSEGRHDYLPQYMVPPMMGGMGGGYGTNGITVVPGAGGTPGTFYIAQPPGHATQIHRDGAGNITNVMHTPA